MVPCATNGDCVPVDSKGGMLTATPSSSASSSIPMSQLWTGASGRFESGTTGTVENPNIFHRDVGGIAIIIVKRCAGTSECIFSFV